MPRPRRPLTDSEIILPPTTFIGGRDRLVVQHDNDPKYQRSFGVVIMAPAGLDLFNSRMRPLDKAVLIALVSKLKWFDIDYEEIRSGNTWNLRCADDGEHIKATMIESGIVTTGLSFKAITEIIHSGCDHLLEILAESRKAVTGNPINRDRATRILNASKKTSSSVEQVRRSISNLTALGVIIGYERAGPDKLYYILNPFLYCNAPTFMRNALIRFVTSPISGSVVNFSEDLSNTGPPRRRKTNADLIRELELKNDFINDVLAAQVLPEEMRERGHLLLGDN